MSNKEKNSGGYQGYDDSTSFISQYLYRNQSPVGTGGGGGVFGNETRVMNHVASGPNAGKVVFTATQWQELERQMMVYKYIMASIPVPPQLLMPLSTQSNKGTVDLRFLGGSDPEPWRCRRTDGKKWRCSRDVAPDQKYCERHTHKNRPRSRKPVEIQPNNTATASSYPNPRCSEWYVTSGTIPVSPSNEQLQQSMNSHSHPHSHSPRVGSKRAHIFPHDFGESSQQDSELYRGLQLDSAGARRQHFIDAWSKSGGGDDCSLTLSMQCSGGMDGVDRSFELGTGDALKTNNQWLSQPGGPLGEALGLRIASLSESEPKQSD